jgi:hypothetical protein
MEGKVATTIVRKKHAVQQNNRSSPHPLSASQERLATVLRVLVVSVTAITSVLVGRCRTLRMLQLHRGIAVQPNACLLRLLPC